MRSKLRVSTQSEEIARFFTHLEVTSPVFQDNGLLPRQYTCDGANINPSVDIAGIPGDTVSLAMIMEDTDPPGGRRVHWLAWNIKAAPHLTEARRMEAEGLNDFHTHDYRGPCPAYGTHHYSFHVFALDTTLQLSPDTKEPALQAAMSGHIVGYGKITALYKRN